MSDYAPALNPILARIPDAAAMIGRGVTFLYEAIADGRIKAVKSDGRTLVLVSSLGAIRCGVARGQNQLFSQTKRSKDARLKRNGLGTRRVGV
jgi:hypothetical protein